MCITIVKPAGLSYICRILHVAKLLLFHVDTDPYQLVDLYGKGIGTRLLARSAFGLVTLYNLLPGWVFQTKTVKGFQRKPQELVKPAASAGCNDWVNFCLPV